MIDWSRPIQTRDGRKARVLATDFKGRRNPIVIAVENGGYESILHCAKDGGNACDIINAPTKRKGWVNVLKETSSYGNPITQGVIFQTHDEAIENPRHSVIATVPIEWEE